MAAHGKVGRPPRKKPVEKLNLLVTTKAKQDAYTLASDRGLSVGRLFEYLLEREHAKTFGPPNSKANEA